MRRSIILILFILPFFLTGCDRLAAGAQASTLAKPAQVAEDWRVYQAVISDLQLQSSGAVILMCEPGSNQDGLPIDLARHPKVLLRDLQVHLAGSLKPATLINFRDRNQAETVSASDFPAQPGLVFLDSEDLDLLSGEDKILQSALRSHYPGSRGLVAFSFVGYDENHAQALVYARYPTKDNRDEGNYLVLEERAGEWQVIQRIAL